MEKNEDNFDESLHVDVSQLCSNHSSIDRGCRRSHCFRGSGNRVKIKKGVSRRDSPYTYFFLDFPALFIAIATLCFSGLPASRSVLMFSLTTFLLDPDLRGMVYPLVNLSYRILHMNKFLTSLFFIICIQCAYATTEDAIKFAEEKILVFELHMEHCEEMGYNNGLVMDYQYHNGYMHGARDAYQNMLKKIYPD